MTEKLTTAEVRLAATTNLDLPLTQYKKLESGFDAWLQSVQIEAAKKAIAAMNSANPVAQKTRADVKKPQVVQDPALIDSETSKPKPTVSAEPAKTEANNAGTPVRPQKRKRVRPKKRGKSEAAESPNS